MGLDQRDLIRGIARVWRVHEHGGDAEIVGTAMLVAPRRLLTCAHVVAAALALPADGEAPRERNVTIDLPAVEPGRLLRARVALWLPRRPMPGGAYDIAGLLLDVDPSEGAQAVPLSLAEGAWQRSCRVFGFPAGRPDGSYAAGSLRDVLANGWVMMRGGAEAREFTRPGYSGGPVYDEHGVLGMLTEGDRDQRVREAVMIPTETLLGAWPEIALLHRASPYPGLAPFGSGQSHVYFGRRAEVAALLRELRLPPHVKVLAGASGSGKSSLLRAGLAQVTNGSWRVLHLTPGARPYDALARSLVTVLQDDLPAAARLQEVARWREALVLSTGLADALSELVARAPSGARHILALDHAEELFTQAAWHAEVRPLVRERRRQQETHRGEDRRRPLDAARFVAELVVALGDPRLGGRVALLLAVRTDHLDALLGLPVLASLHARSPLVHYLGPVEDLREVIEGPLQAAGLTRAEPGLVDRLLQDLQGETNALPLLAFTLRELWQRQHAGRLTHAAYDELGGVGSALAGVAQSFYDELDEARQLRLREVLVQLALPLEGRTFTRRVTPLAGFSEPERALLEQLADRRLVTIDRDRDGEPNVSVVHEALLERWPALRAWLDARWEFRRWQEGLRNAMGEWRALGEDAASLPRGARLAQAEGFLLSHGEWLAGDEREFLAMAIEQREREAARERQRSARERRWQRALIGGLSGALVIVLALAAVASWNWGQARQAQQAARERAEAATLANDRLAALALELERSLGGATEALAAQIGARAMLIDLGLDGAAADPGLGLLLAAHATRLHAGPVSFDALLRTLQREPRFAERVVGGATAVATHGDSGLLVGKADGSIAWFRLDDLAVPHSTAVAHTGRVASLALSADAAVAASAGDDGWVRLWALPELRPLAEPWRAHELPVHGLTFGRAGEVLVSVALDGEAQVWEVGTREALTALARSPAPPHAPAEAVPIGAGRDGGIPVALASARLAEELIGLHGAWSRALAFAPGGEWLAYAASASEVRFLDPEGGWAILASIDLGSEVSAMVAKHDGEGVIVGFADGSLAHVASTDARVTRVPQRAHVGPVAALALAPDGNALGALGFTGVASIVDPISGKAIAEPYLGTSPAAWFLALTESHLITADGDGGVTRWHRLVPDSLARPVARRQALPTTLAASADGRLAVGWNDGTVELYGLDDGSLLASRPRAHAGRVNALLGLWEEGRLVSAGSDGRLVLRELEHLAPVGDALWSHREALWSIVPAGERGFWVGGVQGLAQRWHSLEGGAVERHEARTGLIWTPAPEVHEAAGGRLRAVRLEHAVEVRRDGELVWASSFGNGGAVTDIGFDAEGERFLAYRDFSFEVRETEGFALLARLNAAGGHAFAVDPSGRWLATSVAGGAVQLWDARTLLAVGPPLGSHSDAVQRMTFDPHGSTLIVASNAGEVVAWDVDPERWLASACDRAAHVVEVGEWTALLAAIDAGPACPAAATVRGGTE